MLLARRALLRRLGVVGLSLPMASALLAACSTPIAVAPTSPATSAPATTAATAAAKPTSAPTTAPTTAAAAKPTAAAQPTSAGQPTTAAAQASSKPKAIIGITQEPTSMDVTADATASIALTLRDNLYEGLVRLDGSGKIVGSLAKSWDVSPDGTSVTFHLVNGAKWHDGSPFTAQDVKFSWDRAADSGTKPPNPHKDYWAPVKSVDVVDDATVKVTLSAYSDNWLFHMGSGSAAIVSNKSIASNATNPVGTGPFKFGQWNHGSSVTLMRNDDYWGNKARLQSIEFRVFSDSNAMVNALKAGDIDAAAQQVFEQVPQFEQDPNFTVLRAPSSGKVMVSVNEAKPPLNDKRVRQALYAAIDRKAWIDGFYAGYADPIGSHATPNDGEPYYVDMTSVNTYDPTKAKQLLAAAGQDNLKLRLAQISAFPYTVRLTDILVSQFADIGVTLDVQPMEFPRWLQQVFGGSQDYDLTIINHVEERDIGNYANPKYYWHYDNPDVAAALKQADAEPETGKRNGIYRGVLQTLADDAANLWVAAQANLGILKKGLQGYQVSGISPALYLAEAYFA